MDSKKIGEFIAGQRKAKHLTQKQLGETLGISDKAVSKWECGKGLPDISIILPLCDLLDTNVNELLSGERLTQDTYPKKAEENMIHLIQNQDDRNKKKELIIKILLGIAGILIIVAFLIFLLAFNGSSKFYWESAAYYIDMVGLLEIIFIMFCSLLFAGRLKDFKNAFFFLLHDTENIQKLENAIQAITLAEKSLLFGGSFCSIFYAVQTLAALSDYDVSTDLYSMITVTGMSMGVALLTLFYGIFAIIILTPVKCRLIKKSRQIQNTGRTENIQN